MLFQAVVVMLACAAEAPAVADPARKLTEGFFYDAALAARMEAGTLTAQDEGAVNVSFRGKTVKVDHVMEDETFPCTVVKTDDTHWVIETRRNGEVTRHPWTWTGPGKVKTDLAGARDLVWLPRPFQHYAQLSRKKRTAGGAVAGAFQSGDGTRLTVDGATAQWSGKKHKAEVVPCLLDCDTGKPARCLVLGKKVPYTAIFLQEGKALEEVVMPGLCPDGLGVERQEQARVFQSVP